MSTSTPKPHEIPQDYADALHAYQCAIASHEETLSELAALRAENERLRSELELSEEERSNAYSYARDMEAAQKIDDEHSAARCAENDSLRAQLTKCQVILRRCFAVEDVEGEGESVLSLDCPTIEDYRAALEAKP